MIEALFGFIARLIASVLALVLVCGIVLTLQARSADRVLLDPLTYQLALAGTNTYLRLPDLVTAEVMALRRKSPEPKPDDIPALLLHSLEPQDLHNLTTLLLPSAEVQRVTEETIEQALGYTTMRRDTVVVDLSGLKRNALGKNGALALEILAGALPECGTPGCPSSTQVAERLDPATVVGALPDALPLVEGPEVPDPRKELATARMLLGFAPLALLALLAVVGLFGARSRAGWLRWSGVPLLVAGAIAVVAGVMAAPGIELAWGLAIAGIDDLPSPETMRQLRAVFDAVAAEYVHHLQFEGGAVALVGFALTLFSFFVPERRLHGA